MFRKKYSLFSKVGYVPTPVTYHPDAGFPSRMSYISCGNHLLSYEFPVWNSDQLYNSSICLKMQNVQKIYPEICFCLQKTRQSPNNIPWQTDKETLSLFLLSMGLDGPKVISSLLTLVERRVGLGAGRSSANFVW